MILRYDPKELQLYVMVGSEEEYTPCKDIIAVDKKLRKLRAKMIKLKEKEGGPLTEEINALLVKYSGAAKTADTK